MSDFYLILHSDASSNSFPTNRPGHFKTILSREINLGEIEYNVAISSITRYYETSMEDLVFIREKRAVPVATPGLTRNSDYEQIADKTEIVQKYEAYLKATDPLISYDEANKNKVKLTVGLNSEEFEMLPNPFYLKDISKASGIQIHQGGACSH